MAEFLIIQTIVNLVFGIIWSQKTGMNLFLKVMFIVLTAVGAYLLFGPANIVATLSK